MISPISSDALIRKAQARWQHYVLLARWQRADRIRRLLQRIQRPARRLRLTA